MSDFDKIFRDKLNEEENFPRMDRNWQRVFSRLPVEPLAPKISWWQWAVAASVAGLVVSNLWFWYDLNRTKQELKTATAQQAQTPNSPTIVYQRDTVFMDKSNGSTIANVPNSPKEKVENASISIKKEVSTARSNRDETAIPFLKENTIASDNTTKVHTPSVFSPNSTVDKPIVQDKNKAAKPDVKNDIVSDMPIVQKEVNNGVLDNKKDNIVDNIAKNKTDIAQNIEDKPVDKPSLNPQNQATKNGDIVENTSQKDIIKDKIAQNNKAESASTPDVQGTKSDINLDKKSIDNQIDTTTKIADTDISKQTEKIAETTISPTISSAEKNDVNTEKVQEDKATKPIIQPIKWRPTFALGAHGLAYLPKNVREIPSSRGFGASFRIGITERLKVDMAFEKAKVEYTFLVPKPTFHHPKDRNRPPSLDVELKEIQGSQTRSQLTVNVNYFLATEKWINPYVSIGYANQRVASQRAKFEYFDKRLNNKITVFEVSDPQSFNNLLNVGFGAEMPIYKGLSLAASAHYQKDFSNKIDDSWLLRGGLRYTF
jgi:opacity protein-like surface antigen